MKNILSRTFRIVITILLIQPISTRNITAQSITVFVKGEMPLEMDQIDIYVELTETAFDFVQPEYPNQKETKPISTELFLAEINAIKLPVKLIESNTESEKFYAKYTTKKQPWYQIVSATFIIDFFFSNGVR